MNSSVHKSRGFPMVVGPVFPSILIALSSNSIAQPQKITSWRKQRLERGKEKIN